MVYQNYHLIHHLYLNVPFYNHLKTGHLKYGELVAERPAVQSAFGLMPLKLGRALPFCAVTDQQLLAFGYF